MVIYLVAIGSNMPAWIKQGFDEYASRLRNDVELRLIEVVPEIRRKNSDTARILRDEGERQLKAVPKNCYIVGLDLIGRAVTTPQLSKQLEKWMHIGQDIAVLIGGPEGFDNSVKAEFNQSFSLSKLTLPHPMVRVIFAEQVFRAWSIIHNHPYHRD